MVDESNNIRGYTFRLDENLIKAVDYIAVRETKRTKYRLDRSQILRRALDEFIEKYYTESPPTEEELKAGVIPIDFVIIEKK